jgi:hypothetical protein
MIKKSANGKWVIMSSILIIIVIIALVYLLGSPRTYLSGSGCAGPCPACQKMNDKCVCVPDAGQDGKEGASSGEVCCNGQSYPAVEGYKCCEDIDGEMSYIPGYLCCDCNVPKDLCPALEALVSAGKESGTAFHCSAWGTAECHFSKSCKASFSVSPISCKKFRFDLKVECSY